MVGNSSEVVIFGLFLPPVWTGLEHHGSVSVDELVGVFDSHGSDDLVFLLLDPFAHLAPVVFAVSGFAAGVVGNVV